MLIDDYKRKLKIVQEIKNRINLINISSDKTESEYKNIRSLETSLTNVSDYYFSQIPDCYKIQVLENQIIHSGEIVKLKTNVNESEISLNEDNEIIFDGYVPMDGYLILYTEKDENNNICIYAKNNIPNYDIDKFLHYDFCDKDISINCLSGSFEIKRGSTIGILISNKKTLSKQLKK